MSVEERATLVSKVRAENPERWKKLEELLADHGKSTIEIDNRTFIIEHLSSDPPPLNPGDVLQKRFRIVRQVGAGGMGDVYEAVDLTDDRTVALKTVTGEFASDPRAVGYMQAEVNLALQVSGPDVCRIHAFYPADSSHPRIPFFTMEFLKGLTLSDKLRMSGPFSPAEVKRIARDICSGLTAIHQERIVHRDMKPRNVMLVERSDREHAVVMDFGIAHRADPSHQVEAMAGTVEYMAPEQFEGKTISAATDIFGVGVLLMNCYRRTSISVEEASEGRDGTRRAVETGFNADQGNSGTLGSGNCQMPCIRPAESLSDRGRSVCRAIERTILPG